MNGCKFRRRHPFGDYILDFVSLEAKLVIELDGGQHASAQNRDAQRTADLEQAGFRVLRFWDHDVLQELEEVKDARWLALRTPSPLNVPPQCPS